MQGPQSRTWISKITAILQIRTPLGILYLFLAFAIPISEQERPVPFATESNTFMVLEGDTVNLECVSDDVNLCDIHFGQKPLVKFGRPTAAGSSNEYEFHRNETTCSLKIKQITRRHTSTYWCKFPVQVVILEVMYTPKNPPLCLSNYERNVFFDDPLQRKFQFNCSSEEGNPSVNITLFNHGTGKEIKSPLDPQVTIERTNESVIFSYSPYLDSSFNNTIVDCYVNQQLPAPYGNSKKNCSFEPLTLLPTFSLRVVPNHHTVKIGVSETMKFTCSTNVTNVILAWVVYPPYLQHSIDMINQESILHIVYPGSIVTHPISAQCKASYGGRLKVQNVTFHVKNGSNNAGQRFGNLWEVWEIILLGLIV